MGCVWGCGETNEGDADGRITALLRASVTGVEVCLWVVFGCWSGNMRVMSDEYITALLTRASACEGEFVCIRNEGKILGFSGDFC